MNRNNGREIGERLNLLKDYIIQNADKTHAVRLEDLQIYLANAGFDGKNGVALNKKTIYRDLEGPALRVPGKAEGAGQTGHRGQGGPGACPAGEGVPGRGVPLQRPGLRPGAGGFQKHPEV